MRRRLAIVGTAASVIGVCGVAWAVGPGWGDSLDTEERAVVDAIEAGELSGNPSEAARFVDEHVDVLLSKDLAKAVDGDLAALFDTALGQEDDLLGRVVAAVADEGVIHSDRLRPVLAEAAAARMPWIDKRISAPGPFTAMDLPDDVEKDFLDLHDFLRETMRDPGTADLLRQAMDDYGMAETSTAPDVGDARHSRLRDLGRIMAFFGEAQRNAERGQAIKERDLDALDEAEAANRARHAEVVSMESEWVVTDLYDAAGPVGADVRRLATGQPFVDADGALEADMNEDEAQAFQAWATSLTFDGMPASYDAGSIGAGRDDILRPDYGVFIDDRY